VSTPAEGIIRIALSADSGKGAARIENARPLGLTSRFQGKKPAEVASLVPLVFSICRAAQSTACAEAIEHALGSGASERTKAIRSLLVLGEAAREHALQVLHAWPHCVHAPEPALASASIKRLLVLDRELGKSVQDAYAIDFARLDHAISELTAILGEAIFGEVPDEWLLRSDSEDLAFWARRNETLAQTIFEYLVQTGTADAGAAEIAPLPQIKAGDLQAILLGGSPDAFVAQPEWDGQPRETTPLSRLAKHPLIESVRERHGYGLLARLAACLAELAEIPCRMRALAGSLAEADHDGPTLGRNSGTGLGFAEAARGRLIHAVEIADGVVQRYRILAPTEWNFHPHGAAAKGLASIAALPPERREALARLFITAVDPCVGYELSFA
jgi:coenzyme F420-reducing hydrogenase alpha subunit